MSQYSVAIGLDSANIGINDLIKKITLPTRKSEALEYFTLEPATTKITIRLTKEIKAILRRKNCQIWDRGTTSEELDFRFYNVCLEIRRDNEDYFFGYLKTGYSYKDSEAELSFVEPTGLLRGDNDIYQVKALEDTKYSTMVGTITFTGTSLFLEVLFTEASTGDRYLTGSLDFRNYDPLLQSKIYSVQGLPNIKIAYLHSSSTSFLVGTTKGLIEILDVVENSYLGDILGEKYFYKRAFIDLCLASCKVGEIPAVTTEPIQLPLQEYMVKNATGLTYTNCWFNAAATVLYLATRSVSYSSSWSKIWDAQNGWYIYTYHLNIFGSETVTPYVLNQLGEMTADTATTTTTRLDDYSLERTGGSYYNGSLEEAQMEKAYTPWIAAGVHSPVSAKDTSGGYYTVRNGSVYYSIALDLENYRLDEDADVTNSDLIKLGSILTMTFLEMKGETVYVKSRKPTADNIIVLENSEVINSLEYADFFWEAKTFDILDKMVFNNEKQSIINFYNTVFNEIYDEKVTFTIHTLKDVGLGDVVQTRSTNIQITSIQDTTSGKQECEGYTLKGFLE